jgi:hypothetical protein
MEADTAAIGSPARLSRSAVIFSLTILLAGLYLAGLFLTIPVNTEARNYLVGEGSVTAGRFFSALVYPAGVNMRVVSMLVFGLTRSVCGLNAPCVNAIQILEVLMGLAAGLVHLRQLTVRPLVAAIAMLFWCASLPVFAAGFWQATQHDKLAFLFSLAALSVGLGALRQTRWHAGVVTGLLTGLFVLALNSKEIAFFLPGAAMVQILLFGSGDAERRRRAAAIYGLPIAYAAIYISLYMWRLRTSWQTHVMSGDWLQNAVFYLGSLVWTHTHAVLAVLPLAGLAIAFILVWNRQKPLVAESHDLPTGRIGLYLLAIWLTSTGLAIKALHPADYYLLISAWAFIGWIAAIIEAALRRQGPIKYLAVACTSFLVLLFAWGCVADAVAPEGTWQQLREAHRLEAGYRRVRAFCTPRLSQGLTMVFPVAPAGKWFFFRGGDEAPDQLVGGFICKDGQLPHMTYRFDGSVPPDTRGQLVVVWDRKLRVIRIIRGGSMLYSSTQ